MSLNVKDTFGANISGTAEALSSSAGSATQPIYFSNGKPVKTTYSLGKSVPSDAVFTDTDTKVKQNLINDNANYPILLAPHGQTTATTTETYFDSGVYLNPSTNTIEANITGTAGKAMDDGDGNTITDSYASTLSISGNTLTLKSKSGITLSTLTLPSATITWNE